MKTTYFEFKAEKGSEEDFKKTLNENEDIDMVDYFFIQTF